MELKDKILSVLRNKQTLGLADIHNTMPKENKSVIFYHLQKFVKDGKVIKNTDATYSFIDEKGRETINILYVGAARAGSDDRFIDESGLTTIPIKTSELKHNPDDLMLVSVLGDSMDPTLKDKDLVMFKKITPSETIKDNDIVFVRVDTGTESGFKIKRFKRMNDNYIALLSDNKNFPPIIIDENTDFEIKGKFVSIVNRNDI